MIVDAQAADGEVIWRPGSSAGAETEIGRFAGFLRAQGLEIGQEYDEIWQWSVDHPETFWELFAQFAGVEFGGSQGPVCTPDAMPHTRWFPGRTLNFARHLLEGHDGTALIAVAEDGSREEVSWDALRREVASLAKHLRDLGVGPGDRVVAVLPNVAEAVAGLLATASIGAIWSVCAPEFGAGAIVSRFAQLDPKVVIVAPSYWLGGKERDRREEFREIFAQLPTAEHIIWVTRHGTTPPVETPVPAVSWEQAVASPAEPVYHDVEFSHPLWVLFSSGTTGIPKGIVHGHGGALLEEMKMLLIHSDLRPGDRYYNVASTSWVLWNSLISALGVGATAVLVDGNPTFPTVDRVWQVTAAENVAVLGVSAGFVHACAKTDLVPMNDHDLSALRSLQVTGSPLSADGYRWVYGNVGDIWLSSMSGGTDIASVFVGGSPTLPVRVGYIQAPALGVRVEAWDDAGSPTTGKGELVVTQPMPSMPLQFWGDDGSRYHDSYFSTYPGVWRHGDYIEFSWRGILIHGRSDSTLNRNGLRLGSADIYAAVETLPEVAEALVIGAELGTEYYMPLFVKLSEGADPAAAEAAIVKSIRDSLSARYLPDEIVFMRAIPHTRTGKKLEVPVKRLLQGAVLDDVADLGAVDDPELLEEYAQFALGRHTVAN
ncbi:acetoacetate--CoA ligase [Arthrobacter sulfonylureivorans]|uniref:Acetoacetate--CoA ligase n=1 Tax=Arthrobacter sulfonylureivorans TaxID=2486855 RepID=A0ABY3W5Z5_9MICC|nr:acetoacetate--CoA ligase [Arthrobacter sulfonylureivorans]UNK45704.1 acetoacetate--CoA ligase [Arthrobacter sulfonylureivorans]